MALLDRLRPQPGWKHSDPAKRLEAVETLPDSEQSLLATIAREDDAPRVRRAAVARLTDPDALGAIARADGDDQVRAEAIGRLTALAVDGGDAALGRRAVAGLVEERHLATVARSGAPAEVCDAALARMAEAKALGGIARHAEHESVRLAALGRLNDRGEIEAVATHTEHKDVGLAALERLDDTAVLDAVATRAKNKVVARRARAIVKERAAAEAGARAAADALARRRGLLQEALDGLAKARDRERAASELARLDDEWRALGAAPDESEQRWQRGTERVRMHCDDLARQETLEAERRAALQDAMGRRRTLIDAAQQAEPPDVGERLTALRAEWAALAPIEGDDIRALDREFVQACGASETRAAQRARAAALQSQLGDLAAEATQLAESESLDAARPRWTAIAQIWREQTNHFPIDAALHAQYSAAATRWQQREQAIRDAAARTAAENQARLQELGERAADLASRPDAPTKDIDRAVRDLRAALEAPGTLNAGGDDLLVQLKATLAALTPRLREARETDEWRRWANAGIQEELCKRMEALRDIKDPGEVARQVRDLRRQWKAVSAAPRDDADQLWQRFKTAADEAQTRADTHVAAVAAEQASNLARKLALCDQAETLAQSTDWIATAETLKKLQAEWQTIGPVPREYTREAAKERAKESAAAAASASATATATGTAATAGEPAPTETDAVIADAASSGEPASGEPAASGDAAAQDLTTSDEAAAVQPPVVEASTASAQGAQGPKGQTAKEPVPDVARRFRAACDTFFTRRKTDLAQRKSEWSQNQQQKEALCARMELLAESSDWTATFNEIKKLQAEWKTVGPVRRNKSEALWKRFRGACDRFFERYGKRHELDLRKRVEEREAICRSLEAFSPGALQAVAADASASAPPASDVAPAAGDAHADAVPVAAAADAGDQPSADGDAHGDAVPPAASALAIGSVAETGADAGDAGDAGGDPAVVAAADTAPAPGADAAPPVDVPPPSNQELLRAVEGAWQRWLQSPGLPSEALVPVRARFESALTTVLTTYAPAFKGTRFDIEETRRRMRTLCDDVENVTKGVTPASQLGSTSVTALASLLKESLAANTIGGRVNEEAKARAAADRVRRAQSQWREFGPVPGTEGNQLETRFQRACRRFFEQHPQLDQPQRDHRDRDHRDHRDRRDTRDARDNRDGRDRGPRGQHQGGRPNSGPRPQRTS